VSSPRWAEEPGDGVVTTAAPPLPAHEAQVSAVRVLVWSLARLTVTAIATLLVLAMGPSLLGCRSAVVVSGSMAPEVLVGDVLVARTMGTQIPHRGQVLLVDDPAHPGRLLSHRLVRLNADGTLLLRGDANREPDSTPIPRSAVRGAAVLRVPLIGWPSVWLQQRQPLPLAVTALLIVGAGVLGLRPMPRPRPTPGRRAPAPAGQGDSQAARVGTSRRRPPPPGDWPILAVASAPSATVLPSRPRRTCRRRPRKLLSTRIASVALLPAITLGPTPPTGAVFKATTVNPGLSATAGTLQPPTGLSLSSSCPGATVTATWTATPSTYATGYTLVRKSGGTVQNTITVNGRTTVTQDDTNVANGTYTYELNSTYANWTSTVASASTTVSCSVSVPVTNPGFESGLTGWTCTGGTAGAVGSPVHTGGSAAGVTSTGPQAKCSQNITGLSPNTTYTLKVWIIGSAVGSVGWSPDGVSYSWSGSLHGTWSQISIQFTTGAGVTSGNILFGVTSGAGTVTFDDVALTSP
jgi:signal peptidase